MGILLTVRPCKAQYRLQSVFSKGSLVAGAARALFQGRRSRGAQKGGKIERKRKQKRSHNTCTTRLAR